MNALTTLLGSGLFLSVTMTATVAQPLYVPVEGNDTVLYERSNALLIGAARYDDQAWNRLDTAIEDIEELEHALEKQGFTVETLRNPTGAQLYESMKAFIASHRGKKDRLLIYFSGHGYTDRNRQLGFLVPIDAPDPRRDRAGFEQRAMSMTTVTALAKDIVADHAMLIFDSCFSGSVFLTRANQSPPLKLFFEDVSRPVRQFITAGDENQEVPAKSDFTPAFIQAIDGAADLNKDGYVTGTEVGVWIKDTVVQLGRQTPQYGSVLDIRNSRGDFVFIPPKKRVITKSADTGQQVARAVETEVLKFDNTSNLPHVGSVINPNKSDPVYSNIDIRYLRSARDGRNIIELLDKHKVPYNTIRGAQTSIATNGLSYGPDIPFVALKKLALTLSDGGVKLRAMVSDNNKMGQIEIATFRDVNPQSGIYTDPRNLPLSRYQIESLTTPPSELYNSPERPVAVPTYPTDFDQAKLAWCAKTYPTDLKDWCLTDLPTPGPDVLYGLTQSKPVAVPTLSPSDPLMVPTHPSGFDQAKLAWCARTYSTDLKDWCLTEVPTPGPDVLYGRTQSKPPAPPRPHN